MHHDRILHPLGVKVKNVKLGPFLRIPEFSKSHISRTGTRRSMKLCRLIELIRTNNFAYMHVAPISDPLGARGKNGAKWRF